MKSKILTTPLPEQLANESVSEIPNIQLIYLPPNPA